MNRSNPSKPAALPLRQRGIIGVLAALVLAMVIVTAALALDTGRLMMEKRRLQQRADLAAIAAAQQYCDGAAGITGTENSVAENLQDNGFDPENPDNSVTVLRGTVSSAPLRNFTPNVQGQAVQVQLTRSVPAALFTGGLLGDNVTLRAQATAQRNLIGALSAGSQLLTLNTTEAALLNPLLGAMLGVPLSVTAVGYNRLAQANIKLQRLRDAMISAGVIPTGASLQDIANATPTLGTLISIMADAVDGNTPMNTLLNIRSSLTGSGATRAVPLASILAVDTTPEPTKDIDGSINAMELLMASAMAINTSQILAIGLNVGTEGLTSLLGSTLSINLSLGVIAPPTIAIGRFGSDVTGNRYTQAKTSQVDVKLRLNLNIDPKKSGLLGGLVSRVAKVSGDIGILIGAAQGKAWLDQIVSCPTRFSPLFEFVLGAQPEAVNLRIGDGSDPSKPANIEIKILDILNILGLSLIELDADLGVTVPLANTSSTLIPYSIDLSRNDALPTTPATVTTNLGEALTNGLTSPQSQVISNITPRILGLTLDIPLDAVAKEVLKLLTPVLAQIAQDILQPVLTLLGVQLGTVEVTLLGIEPGQGALLL